MSGKDPQPKRSVITKLSYNTRMRINGAWYFVHEVTVKEFGFGTWGSLTVTLHKDPETLHNEPNSPDRIEIEFDPSHMALISTQLTPLKVLLSNQ